MYAAVLDGTIEPKVGAVAAQIANARARLIETELKIKEVVELEAKLEGMADALERQRNGSAFGSTR